MERKDAIVAEPLDDGRLAALIVGYAVEYAIFTLDEGGRITSWNAGAKRIFGYDADEALGMDFSRLFCEADTLADQPAKEMARALEHGRAEDTRWHVRKGGERFWANGVTMATGERGAACLLKITRDETASKLAEDQRVLLLNELNHRIKNTLATVQSIAENSLRRADVDPAIRRDFTERLIALSDAHNILVAENWAGADFRAVLERGLSALSIEPSRVEADGPDLRLSPQQSVSLALALHELATNAIKHGALSVPQGSVKVTWNLAYMSDGARVLTLSWDEGGGPPARAPERRGFGTRLLKSLFGEPGAECRLHYGDTGFSFVGVIPLSDPEGRALPIGESVNPPA